ncbi:MAG: hypothetical protein U0003_05570 [Vampirovibrionales bacterium]
MTPTYPRDYPSSRATGVTDPLRRAKSAPLQLPTNPPVPPSVQPSASTPLTWRPHMASVSSLPVRPAYAAPQQAVSSPSRPVAPQWSHPEDDGDLLACPATPQTPVERALHRLML